MAKQANATEGKPNLVQKIQEFFQQTMTEMHKVTWPTWDDLKVSTKVTMYLLGIMAAIIFGFDQVFQIAVLLLLNLAS